MFGEIGISPGGNTEENEMMSIRWRVLDDTERRIGI